NRLAGVLAVHNLLFHFLVLLWCGPGGAAPLLFLVAAFDDSQNFVLAHDEVVLTIELDLLAGVLAEQNEVARFDVQGNALAVILHLAVAGGDDLALLRFFLGGVGDDDPADFLFAFLEALNNESVVERSDVHALSLRLA